MIKKEDRTFILFLLLIHLVYFLFQAINQNHTLNDSKEYLQMAENIRQGLFYCGGPGENVNPDFYTKRPPAYPLFIFLGHLICHHPFLILFLQNILSFFSLLWLRNSLFAIGYKTAFDKYFILLSLFSPSQFIYANMIMSEILFQFFVTGMFIFLLLFILRKQWKYMILYHLFLTLGVFTKPILFPFAFINLFFILFISIKQKNILPFLASLFPLVMIILYMNFNKKRTGVQHFSSIQKINLIDYNVNYFLVSKYGEQYADSVVRKVKSEASEKDNYRDEYSFTMQKGKEILLNDEASYVWYHIKGVWRYFMDPGRFDLSNFLGLEDIQGKGLYYILHYEGWKAAIKFLLSQNVLLLIFLIMIMFFNILKTAGLMMFEFNSEIPVEIRLFVFLLVFYFAGVTGPIAASRFAVPVLPLFIGTGAMSIRKIVIWIKKRLIPN